MMTDMDDKDLIIQDLRSENAAIRRELDAAVADLEQLLGQDRLIWTCWACARVYEATPCRNLNRPCAAVWRGLETRSRFAAIPTYNDIRKEYGYETEFRPRRKKGKAPAQAD